MKGRKQRLAGNGETDEALRTSTRSNTKVSHKEDVPKPKSLQVIHGKRAGARMDKPVRGKTDAYAYKSGGGIHIKKGHKGLLHKDLHVAQGKPIPMAKIEKAEHSSNPKIRKRAQFADNAKKFNH